MEYTREEISLAKAISSPDMIALLRKVLSEKYTAEKDLEKLLTLPNDQYGEIMKVNQLMHQHVNQSLNKIKILAGQKVEDGNRTTTIAPR